MHFNVLKGEYPGLKQLDKTLPVKSTATGIERGSILVEETEGGVRKFRPCVAGDATVDSAMVYHAFMAQTDPDVVMAGGITGMPCIAPVEIETDMYNGTPTVGAYLTAGAGGKLVAHTSGDNIVGLVTAAPYTRWSNVATPTGGSYPSPRQGATVNVIALWSCWIPAAL